jgi:DNA-binding NarL/FixJ family response regulator
MSAPSSPRIVVYSGAPADALAVAGAVAGADAVVSKADTRVALLHAIRAAARGELHPVTPRSMGEAAHRIAPDDYAVLAMRVAGTPFDEIARTLRISVAEVVTRSSGMVARLTARDPMPVPTRAPRRPPRRRVPTSRRGRVEAGWPGP